MANTQDTRLGNVRLRIQTTQHSPTWATVGPFQSLGGARRLAEDLIAQRAVQAVRVEHRQRGGWRPAWSFAAGLTFLLVVSLPTLAPTRAEAWCPILTGPDGLRQMAECQHREIQQQLDTIRRQQEDAELQRQNDELNRRIREENQRMESQRQCIGIGCGR